MKTFLKKCVLPLALAAAALSIATAHAAPDAALQGKNVVLVHGAFADGSSWNKVIPILQAKGLHVVAVQNPLSSLGDDVAATRRVIEQQNGPVVLVGHSWGGPVITQAGVDPKVKALVYVAAFAPDKGQTVNDMLKGYPAPSWASELRKDTAGFLTLSDKAIIQDFASDLPAAQGRLIAATQGPWFSGALDQRVSDAAWHEKPSWFVVSSRDHMIDPKLQSSMARDIGATVVKVDAGHLSLMSKPEQVAAAIIAAAGKAQ
jgi:pimeloyl-ACP methyl ester carboxylesterase